MIGIAIAAKNEWKTVLNKYNVEKLEIYPYGEYFRTKMYDEEITNFYKKGRL